MASLSRYEQETVIRFNEEEREAVIFTYNRALQRQMDKLAEERPGEVTLIRAEKEGTASAKEYRIHKQWVKVRPSRILSEEEKAVRAELLRSNKQKQQNANTENILSLV